ncbi:hypothetical protein ADL08_09975 [Streptomyces sp. NRRL F-6492]|nr:hypothetical protein ADL08_09975 [Streptomyces sp. NRRL F-6492]
MLTVGVLTVGVLTTTSSVSWRAPATPVYPERAVAVSRVCSEGTSPSARTGRTCVPRRARNRAVHSASSVAGSGAAGHRTDPAGTPGSRTRTRCRSASLRFTSRYRFTTHAPTRTPGGRRSLSARPFTVTVSRRDPSPTPPARPEPSRRTEASSTATSNPTLTRKRQ